MPSNKDRLHVALYVRGGGHDARSEDKYHWALLVTPKKESAKTSPAGMRHHVINTQPVDGYATPPWQYKTVQLSVPQTGNLLVRITIGKVENRAQLESTLSQLPVDQYPGFTCRTWVADAVAALHQDGSLGTKQTANWTAIQDFAVQYVRDKRDNGRWREQGAWNPGLPATFNLLENKETFP